MLLRTRTLLSRSVIASVLAAWTWTAHGQNVLRTPVPNAKPLLVAALLAENGEAHGVLTGPMGDGMRRAFKGTTPVYIDVSTIKRYRQAGCGRLKALFWMDGAVIPGEKKARKRTVEVGIDYCSDGSAPKVKS